MPTNATRELSVTYGSATYSPDGGWGLDESFEGFTVRFSFLVTGTSESDFNTNCNTARATFRKPQQALTLTQGSTSRVFDPASGTNTGLEIKSRITKETDHIADTGRSRRFMVEITGGQPADNATTAGLREFSTSMGVSPSGRKLVVISGVYTANGSSGARAVYTAGIDALCASALSGVLGGGTFEKIAEDPTLGSYHDQTLAFSRTYHEVMFGQAGSGDDTSIVEQALRVAVRKTSAMNAPSSVSIPSAGGSGGGTSSGNGVSASGGQALPLIEASAQYEAWISRSATTGVAGLAAKWTSIRAWVLTQIANASGGGAYAVESEEPSYFPDDNRISCSIRVILSRTGVTRRTFTKDVVDNPGGVLVPVWNGNNTANFNYDGPRIVRATYTLMEETVSGGAGGSAGGGSGGGSNGFGGVPNVGYGLGIFDGGQGPIGLVGHIGAGLGIFDPVNPGGGGGIDNAYYGPGGSLGSNSGGGSSGGSGGSGGGNDGGSGLPTDSIIESDEVISEPMSYGTDNPLTITRTTHVRVIRYFTRVGQPAGYAGGATG